MANKVGIVLALDGEKEFTQGLSNASKAAQATKAELKNLDATYEGSANTLEYLQKKQQILTAQTEAYAKKVASAKSGQENANKTLQSAKENYENVKKKLEEAKESLEKMTSSGTANAEEVEKQTEAVKKLEEQLKDQGTEVGKCEGKISDWTSKLNTAESELTKANNALDKNEQYLEEAKNATDKCATSIDGYGKSAESATTVTTSLGDKLTSALANTAVSAGLSTLQTAVSKLTDALKKAVEVGSSFEAEMSTVAAITGSTGTELDSLSEKAKELGQTTQYSATEAATAFEYMALAGWSTEEMLEGVDAVLQLAAASGMELADASDMITDYLSAFNLSAAEATTVADMLAYAQANSNTTAEQLGEAYGNCAANLSAAGQDIETVTALLSAMANQGEKGSTAGTKLKSVMSDITSNMKDGAIAIGDTTVAVQDADGNFRDLTDIIKDVNTATQGMGTAEKQAALLTTFTTNSVSALNLILNEGVDNLEDFESALRAADGAAESMATTMQDNLQGDLSALNSALEGLGVEVYEYISGPLRSVVQGVTTLINGITDAVSPQQSAISQLVSEAKNAKDNLESALAAASSTVSDAEASGTRIELLGNQLISLASSEELTLTQKERMAEIVSELSESIPELAAAYDEETGKLNLSNEAVKALTASTKQLMLVQAMQTAADDELAAYAEAKVALAKAELAQESYETALSFWQALQEETAAIYNEYGNNAENYEACAQRIVEAQEVVQQAFEEGTISVDEYNEMMETLGNINGYTAAENALMLITERMQECGVQAKDAAKTTEGLSEALDEAEEEYNAVVKAIDSCTEAYEESEKAVSVVLSKDKELIPTIEEVAEAITGNMDAAVKLTGKMEKLEDAVGDGTATEVTATTATRNLAAATEEFIDSASDAAATVSMTEEELEAYEEELAAAATAAEESAATQETAFNNIYDAYTSTMESIKSDLQNKLNLADKFDGGDDVTTETMNANLESYIEGLQNYKENLEKVRQYTDANGQAIFSDEVLAAIESQGTDMANMLEHIVWTWENQGEYGVEQVKGIADKYQEYFDLTEEIASASAANQTAYSLALGELGSTEADFSSLREAIDAAVAGAADGWSGLTDETQAALESAISTAKALGVQIPDGLADSISGGSVTAEQAVEQMNASIQGALEGLLQVAQDSGADVSEELASSITAGTADAQTAMEELMAAIGNSAGSTGAVAEAVTEEVSGGADAIAEGESAYEESGAELVEAIAEGVKEGASTVEEAVAEVIDAAAEAAGDSAKVEAFKDAGVALGEALVSGISEVKTSGEQAQALADEALEALNASKNTDSFKAAGNAGAFAYNTGLSTGTMTADTGKQAQKLVDAAKDTLGSVTNNAAIQGKGSTAGAAFGTGLGTQATNAANQAQTVANAAIAEAGSHTNEFNTAGYNMAQGLATGITSGKSLAVEAAKATAKAALQAAKDELEIKSPSRKFKKEVGAQIAAGLASGIEEGTDTATKSATKLSSSVYKAATAWLTEYKSSHAVTVEEEAYFWSELTAAAGLGAEAYNTALAKSIKSSVSKTTTTGTGSNAKTTKKDTETYYSDVLSAAKTYMTNLQTLQDVSTEDQISYWTAVKSELKKGTQAWYDCTSTISSLQSQLNSEIYSNAQTELNNYKVLNDMSTQEEISYWKGILKTVTKYSQEWYDIKSKIKDLKEQANSEIYSDAVTNLANTKTLNDLSIKEEIAYWENVKSQLKKGTQAWYDAVSQINSLKAQIGTTSNMSKVLSAYKTYYNASLYAEMQYWDIVRQNYEEGTDERLEADQLYFEAKEAYYEELTELEQDYADAVADIEEELADKIQTLQDEYENSLQSRISEIMNAFSLFDEFTSSSVDGKTLLFNLQSQAAGYEAWSEALDALEARGILSEDLLTELTEMGPDELAAIYALSDLTDEELTAYQEAYDRKTAAAQKQAEEDTAELKASTEEQTEALTAAAAEQTAALKAAYEASVAEVNATISDELLILAANAESIAEDQTTALVAAIDGGVSQILAVLNGTDSSSSGSSSSGSGSSSGSNTSSTSDASSSAASDSILAIIRKGTARSATVSDSEAKSHTALWQYVVENYGYSLSSKLMGQLATALGVSVASTTKPTTSEKKKILKALKAAGYKSGGRNVGSEIVWMDEELDSLGPELVVSRSDNALLTRIPSGSDIIDAGTTDNLLRLAKIDPDELLSLLGKQQAAATSYLEEIASYGGTGQLNELTQAGTMPAEVLGDFLKLEDTLGRMESLLGDYLPYLAQQQQIVLDSGELVGGISDKMSNALAMKSRRRRS